MADHQRAPDAWTPFSAAERETFFAAIARHRRASWRVTAACAAAVSILALVVAILMAPALYCLLGLGFDLVNLVTPAPDLLGTLGRLLDPLFSSDHPSPAMFVRVGLLAALPGAVLMAVVTYGLRRIWMKSPLFDAGELPGRPPDRTVLEELRLSNVVEEMAIAAGIPPPRVVIVAGGANAAACGRDQAHVTLLVGEALTTRVDRGQLEGMVAHLVGSIANGDMPIGLRVTTTLALFALLARFGVSLNDRREFRQTAKLWRVFIAPTSANTVALLGALADPFHSPPPEDRVAQTTSQKDGLTWREWLVMPLMGPVVLAGFLSGLVSEFFLEPLVALAWRQRKYMADATAVQLSRDPDGLAGALGAIVDSPKGIAPWTAHLAVASDPQGRYGPFGVSIVPIFPSIQKRMTALARMGAHVAPKPATKIPWPLAVIFGVLMSVVAGLLCVVVYLLVLVSAALSGLFSIMPAAALHFLLRWLGR